MAARSAFVPAPPAPPVPPARGAKNVVVHACAEDAQARRVVRWLNEPDLSRLRRALQVYRRGEMNTVQVHRTTGVPARTMLRYLDDSYDPSSTLYVKPETGLECARRNACNACTACTWRGKADGDEDDEDDGGDDEDDVGSVGLWDVKKWKCKHEPRAASQKTSRTEVTRTVGGQQTGRRNQARVLDSSFALAPASCLASLDACLSARGGRVASPNVNRKRKSCGSTGGGGAGEGARRSFKRGCVSERAMFRSTKWCRPPFACKVVQAVADFRNGRATAVEIAKVHGVPPRTLRRYVRRSRNPAIKQFYLPMTALEHTQLQVLAAGKMFGTCLPGSSAVTEHSAQCAPVAGPVAQTPLVASPEPAQVAGQITGPVAGFEAGPAAGFEAGPVEGPAEAECCPVEAVFRELGNGANAGNDDDGDDADGNLTELLAADVPSSTLLLKPSLKPSLEPSLESFLEPSLPRAAVPFLELEQLLAAWPAQHKGEMAEVGRGESGESGEDLVAFMETEVWLKTFNPHLWEVCTLTCQDGVFA